MAKVTMTGLEWGEIVAELSWDTVFEDIDLMEAVEGRLPDEYWESEGSLTVELEGYEVRRVAALHAEFAGKE